jgi:hypothetical protein
MHHQAINERPAGARHTVITKYTMDVIFLSSLWMTLEWARCQARESRCRQLGKYTAEKRADTVGESAVGNGHVGRR